MSAEVPHVRLHLETAQPVALSDFIAEFSGIGSQFERFVAEHFPEAKAEGEFYVKEVRDGSIEADLVAWVASSGAVLITANAISGIDQIQILSKSLIRN